MTRLKFPEIVIMLLAVLGGFGILFFICTRLVLRTLTRTAAETGGGTFAISGGVSTRLLTFMVLVVVALIVMAALALWRR